MIKRESALFDEIQEKGASTKLIASVIKEHIHSLNRLNELYDYYSGRPKVMGRAALNSNIPNNKVAHPFPKYIVTVATGYLLGDKIKYSNDEAQDDKSVEQLKEKYSKSKFHQSDEEIAKYLSIYGKALEVLYTPSDDASVLRSAVFDPRQAFVVYTDDIECKRMFGVYYYKSKDLSGNDETVVTVYTKYRIIKYRTKGRASEASGYSLCEEYEHFFGDVPMIEYHNNEEEKGDFEDVLTLIDAYNVLQSDRVNDIEKTVQAILFVKGFQLDDGQAKELKSGRLLQVPNDNADMKWVSNPLDQTGIEVLRKNLEDDISKFSFVPNMNDRDFANNVSGVAMKYKLIGLDLTTKIKKRYMEKGLRERIRILVNLPNWANSIDVDKITVEFTHSLPVNEMETAQMVTMLNGTVSRETLLGLLPFVSDPRGEMEVLEKDKKENEESADAEKL